MARWLGMFVGVLGVLFVASAVHAAPGVSYSVGVCDPGFSARCIKPTIDGKVVVTSGVALNARTPAAASSLVIPAARMLLGFTITAQTSGYVLIIDGNAVPGDGAIAPGGCFFVPPPNSVGESTTITMANTPLGTPLTTGLVLMFSTTGCFTKTTSALAFISVLYQ